MRLLRKLIKGKSMLVSDDLIRYVPCAHYGSLHHIAQRWLLYLRRRPEIACTEYVPLLSFWALLWPAWRAWDVLERRAVMPLLRWAYVHGVIVWPECTPWRYRYLPKMLWFTAHSRRIHVVSARLN